MIFSRAGALPVMPAGNRHAVLFLFGIKQVTLYAQVTPRNRKVLAPPLRCNDVEILLPGR
jgi:hypothetical protein